MGISILLEALFHGRAECVPFGEKREVMGESIGK
jgi:hypothetical protein